MTGGPLAALIGGSLLVLAAGFIVWHVPRRDRYVVRRRAERPRAVLTARLIPSPRAIAGRPPAAGTARRVYVITDAKEVISDGP